MNAFPPGFVILWDQQPYSPVNTRKHVTKAGEEVTLVDWETICPRCGDKFVLSTLLTFHKPTRRCEKCRNVGGTIKGMRKKLRKQVVDAEP